MKHCSQCGQSVTEGAAFCENCGNSLTANSAPPPTVAAQDYPSAPAVKRPGRRRAFAALLLVVAFGTAAFVARQTMPIPVNQYPQAIVGEWKAEGVAGFSKQDTATVVMTFGADGSLSVTVDDSQHYTYTYVLDGRLLRTTIADGANAGRVVEPAFPIVKMSRSSFEYSLWGVAPDRFVRQ